MGLREWHLDSRRIAGSLHARISKGPQRTAFASHCCCHRSRTSDAFRGRRHPRDARGRTGQRRRGLRRPPPHSGGAPPWHGRILPAPFGLGAERPPDGREGGATAVRAGIDATRAAWLCLCRWTCLWRGRASRRPGNIHGSCGVVLLLLGRRLLGRRSLTEIR